MKNYSELKRLAEAAKRSGQENGERWPQDDDWFEPELISEEMAFVKAVSPDAVLELIAANERLESEAIYSAAAFTAACEEVSLLKAEVERLRKDAERYRFLRDGDDDFVSVIAVGENSITFLGGTHADSAVDAAMSKGAGHD